jgi:hypothetical protein
MCFHRVFRAVLEKPFAFIESPCRGLLLQTLKDFRILDSKTEFVEENRVVAEKKTDLEILCLELD